MSAGSTSSRWISDPANFSVRPRASGDPVLVNITLSNALGSRCAGTNGGEHSRTAIGGRSTRQAMLDLFPSRDAGPFGRRQKHARGGRIPVTIVTGFLGAGKTTLVRRFLATPEGQGTAVVINEFGSVGIDDALVRDSAEEITLLGNGCLCCNTRSDLQNALRRLVAEREQRHAAAVPPHPDRDQRPRRSRPDPADVLDRPGARQRVSHRSFGRAGRRRRRSWHARMVGGSAQAGDPRRSPGHHQDRSGGRRHASNG